MRFKSLLFGLIIPIIGCVNSDYERIRNEQYVLTGQWKWVYSRIDYDNNLNLAISQDTVLTPYQTEMEAIVQFEKENEGHIVISRFLNNNLVNYLDATLIKTELVQYSSFVYKHTYLASYDTTQFILYSTSNALIGEVPMFYCTDFPFPYTADTRMYNFYEKIEE